MGGYSIPFLKMVLEVLLFLSLSEKWSWKCYFFYPFPKNEPRSVTFFIPFQKMVLEVLLFLSFFLKMALEVSLSLALF